MRECLGSIITISSLFYFYSESNIMLFTSSPCSSLNWSLWESSLYEDYDDYEDEEEEDDDSKEESLSSSSSLVNSSE